MNRRGRPANTTPSSMNTSIISSMNGGNPHNAASSRSPISSASVSSKPCCHLRDRGLAALHQPRQHHQQPTQPIVGSARAAPRRSRATRHRLQPLAKAVADLGGCDHFGVDAPSEQPRAEGVDVGAVHRRPRRRRRRAGERPTRRRARGRRTSPRGASTRTIADSSPSPSSFGSAGNTVRGSKFVRALELCPAASTGSNRRCDRRGRCAPRRDRGRDRSRTRTPHAAATRRAAACASAPR